MKQVQCCGRGRPSPAVGTRTSSRRGTETRERGMPPYCTRVGRVSEPLADLASPEVELANVGWMGIEHHKRQYSRVGNRGPRACVWPAWRSVGSGSGHTVGGMCMQPAGVSTHNADHRPPYRCMQARERTLNGRSAAAVKELGMTIGGEPQEERR
jgi:hypothetical protein